MLDDTPTDADFQENQGGADPATSDSAPDTAPADKPKSAKKAAAKKAAAKKTTAKKTTAKKTTAKTATVKTAAKKAGAEKTGAEKTGAEKTAATKTAPKKAASKKATAKKAATKPAEKAEATAATQHEQGAQPAVEDAPSPKAKRTRKKAVAAPAADESASAETAGEPTGGSGAPASVAVPLFQVPEATPPKRGRRAAKVAEVEPDAEAAAEQPATDETDGAGVTGDDSGEEAGTGRRRRRRGGRRRRKSGDSAETDNGDTPSETETDAEAPEGESGDEPAEGTSRRRRRRRRAGEDGADAGDDPQNTVTRVRKGRSAEDEITAVSGSTRLEAKKQRRREGREAGRRRAPIVSEAEFLARRESVERVMVIRQRADLTQIGVLEDKVLVEHYVARESQTSLIGNVYLGRVQNVLPSMEAAFVDIGKGRNAVLYAGEVNWSALGHPEGQPRKIESVLSSGQQILVQVTKDPVGHKGARLTSQVSLAGRFLVYVPDGTTSGISRKLPDTERNRLKTLLKEIVPDTAGVIVRTAAEGASEEELTRDVERLKARWEDIDKRAKGSAPQLLYGEPDLTLKVVRDLFTEDFTKMVIEGDDAWETVQGYVAHVAPDLETRLERYRADDNGGRDVFASYRLDEQIHKGLDRKVWLPSGGSLIIDRTEAMTVVDVNTGKFTGSGGNLEETVTKNNLEAAEEIVRQLRLRDIGGIIVVDFIDMVLESNRDLVLRRLVECLGRDRTRHQVAEVTSLGLVQMTRKRIGTGLLEAFSHECEHCHGRGLIIEDAPVEPKRAEDDGGRRGRRRGRGGDQQDGSSSGSKAAGPPSPKDVAAMAQHHAEHHAEHQAEHPDQADEPTDGSTDSQVDEQAEAVELVGAVEPVDAAEVVEAVEVLDAAEATETVAVDGVVEAEEPAVQESPAEPPTEESDPEEPADVSPPSPPEPPRVVTRTRRRAASRPAGPPAAAAAPESAAAVLVDESAQAGADHHDHHDSGPALHVPIKRRGRKR
jgi:ribonuclease E